MRRFIIPRSVKIIAGGVVGTLALATAVIGFAHTKPGRPLLSVLGMAHVPGAAGCPLGYDRAQTPEQREVERRNFSTLHAGASPAPNRPAFGFVLDTTTRTDVLAWGKSHGVDCKSGGGFSDVSCSNVPPSALPLPEAGGPIASIWLNFGEAERLISIRAVRNEPTADAAQATFEAVKSNVDQKAGPPASVRGSASSEYLSGGLLRQASAEYQFQNYYAVARASNMGPQGYVLTEEYRSLAD